MGVTAKDVGKVVTRVKKSKTSTKVALGSLAVLGVVSSVALSKKSRKRK